MRVLVVGLGSMGKRRIRLIKKLDAETKIVGVDSNPSRRDEAAELFGIETAESIEAAGKADAAFVCTSPLSHAAIIKTCLERGMHIFTELNLVSDGYAENIELADKKGLVLFLSSTFLYRDEVRYIANCVKNNEGALNYTYHIGQYLPDWHPWENYKDYFVGDKRTNGCREIMAIELPWLTTLFGGVNGFSAIKSKNTALNIDYNDNYLVTLEHESGTKGALAVDVVSRKAVRNLEIFGENLYLSWDGSPTGLYKYDFETKQNVNIDLYENVDKLEGYSAFVIENAYSNEIATFFDCVAGKAKAEYGFNEDFATLELIDGIEA